MDYNFLWVLNFPMFEREDGVLASLLGKNRILSAFGNYSAARPYFINLFLSEGARPVEGRVAHSA